MANINDLLQQYQTKNKKPKVSTETVKEQFANKMKAIEIKQKEAIAKKKAASLGFDYISLLNLPIPAETISLVEKDTAAKTQTLCFFYGNHKMKLAMVDPNNPEAEAVKEFLEKQYKVTIEVYLVSEYSFQKAFSLYAAVPVFKKVEVGITISEKDLSKFQEELTDFRLLKEKLPDFNISDIITVIIAAALKAEASDIHIEAEEEVIKVRFRIDGVLHDVADMPQSFWPKIIARIKLLARLKLNISNQPQDGRFTIYLIKEKIDVRVSSLPTAFGESVVMRILKPGTIALQFEELGVRGSSFSKLKEQIERPQGMIITTGPTGSGKTTTLYAILNKLNSEDTKIITLEDPIEYKLVGVNQSQIDHSKGYGFADGLRSILRQDPDVVMVGELRDYETADVAINAALTGHLVVSTIHTNSAAGAVPRFLAMNVKPFLLAPALNAIIGQRLVRRICPHCKKEIELDNTAWQKVMAALSALSPLSGETVDLKNMRFYQGQGCDYCNGIGYKGRIGVYEILIMNKEIENLILAGQVSEYDMEAIGLKNGMVTMVQDGLLKALEGITSVQEVFRVCE